MDVYDEEWDGCLETRGEGASVKTYGRLPAREIWDEIMQSAWRAENRVIFIERANKANSYYYAQIVGSNPCLTGDAIVDEGRLQEDRGAGWRNGDSEWRR